MAKRRSISMKAYMRAWVAVSLLVLWSLATATGFLLWLAPHGPRSGRVPLLLGLTKHSWGDVHFWVCIAAVAVTVVHLTIDWRALKACVSHLTNVHRHGTQIAAHSGRAIEHPIKEKGNENVTAKKKRRTA
jgi:hypothetical protein